MRRAFLCVLLMACGDDAVTLDGGPDGSTNDATQNDVTAPDVSADAPKMDAGDGGASPPGAGKTTYACPDGGTLVKPADDLAAAVAASKNGDTICIQGVHRVQQALDPKSNQTWIGVTTDATISGAQILSPWTQQNGFWVYTGPLAKNGPSTQLHYAGATECYDESALQDDVFWNDKRLFRVTKMTDLGKTGPLSNDGLVQPSVEPGRFWFDYQGQAIWIDVDPTNASVDLAVASTIVDQKGTPTNVTLENLTIEKGLSVGIAANNTTEYTLTDMTVRFIHNRGIYMPAGTDASHRTVVQHSLLTQNGQYAMDSTGSWILLKDDEISWNNIAGYRDMGSGNNCVGYFAAGAAKFVQSVGTPQAPGLWLDGVDSHDNIGDGFWTDVHNRYTLVENSSFHDNERNGYFHEISCESEIKNNIAYGNGRIIMNAKNDFSAQGWGIFVSTSSYANVHDNTVWKNTGGGIQLELAVGHSNMLGIPCITPPPADGGDTSHALENNQVHDNAIYACAGTIAGADENGNSGASSLLAPRSNTFTHNAYHAPDANKWWVDETTMTYAAWQSVDDAGTLVQSCSYP
jgi:hypothetical protein